MSSWDHDGGAPDDRAPDEARDERQDPMPPRTLPQPPTEDGQPEQGEAQPVDFSVGGVESLQWAPDPTAEGPALPDLPDRLPAGEPTDPMTSAFAPNTAPTPHPGPPGPPAPYYPGEAGRPQIRPVILGLAALAALLIMGLVVVALQGGSDNGSDGAAGSEVPSADLGKGSSLIVGTTGVVGMWSGSEWEPRADGDQAGAGIELSVVGLGEILTTVTGEVGDPVADSCASDGAADQDVRVPLEAGGPGAPPPVAVAGVDDPLPRPIEHFETSETYRDAAAEVAQRAGATTPPTVTQVVRVDLDGTGTDEVVVAAEHLSDPEGLAPSPGDWSMVFVRRVAGNEVTTDVLASSIAEGDGSPLERVQVSAVADLNGDGAMEVVLSGRSASGDWIAVHADGERGTSGELTEVLRSACGA